ncbi:MAG: 1-acyl-sn-glycerol-3-phosphate acyltransferase [Saprospiraceae bacterium]|nr:1-acyl-sn-glycerol-3-phosphate acyltransferase [Lewinella sp.]
MQFEDIRPYYDSEYQTVIQNLLRQPAFIGALCHYFPDLEEDKLKQILLSCSSIRDFQQRIISSVVETIVKQSMTDLYFSGLENLPADQPHLFMSNHRDIVLDSAFLNYGLNKAGLDTSQIAIGSNLLGIDWVKDLVRINKSFIVKRSLSKLEMLEASRKLSAYIDHVICEKKESIWIAQREGRSKDGDDRTNPGILKMFGLGTEKDQLRHLMDLNIIPVSISYEYDPCDYLKIPELIARSKGEVYAKAPDEDVKHMLCGIQGFKGRAELTFSRSINDQLAALIEVRNKNEQLRAVARIIDREIFKNYRLWPSNYIAADLLRASHQFGRFYSQEEKAAFLSYMEPRLSGFTGNFTLAREIFLRMYANPLFNQLAEGD